jgi:LysM repeat protein
VGALASRYGSSLDAIQQANGLNDSYLIFRGQGLIIPVRIVPLTETPAPTTVVVVVTATSAPVTGGSGDVVTSPGGSVYVVRSGDNLSSIARQFNTTVGTLVQLNGIANPNRINVGQQIALPGSTGGPDVVPTSPPVATLVPAQPTSSGIIPTQPASGGGTSVPATYVVQPGDNLYRIAIRFNVSLVEMGALNNITNYNLIFIGQVLQLPL